MGMYTWLSDIEFKCFSTVDDKDVNEALQEVRSVMPEWYVQEKAEVKRLLFKKPVEIITYTVYQRQKESDEVRYQISAKNRDTILNLLYGLFMGYKKCATK